ncbi:low molecular weight protein-tyrosine-phosphatase [Thalassococcus lentus]|uniref:protein-tyrosine-phosphatase n=1 Tax=Thalassococcus lentus TaxID=1210524 RepID=A0ABT4XUX5_9RHOB|nr:low molecular weight protein-tyrosine-phosphatase [Thalassococcus lentus]MDA7425770.1 low molecular weight phosphotyrosine protein phosphatase [Thalassococcus lentus]
MTQRILFVCLGNICRSPTAEGVVRTMAVRRGIDVVLDSAGTASWHVGKPPYAPMQEAAEQYGYDLSSLRARQVRPQDFESFDKIIAMDTENMSDLQSLAGSKGAPVVLFTDYAPDLGMDHVPDPYFTRDFDGALRLIESCAQGLLDELEGGQ